MEQEEPEIDRVASYRELDTTFESLRGDYKKSSSRLRKNFAKSNRNKKGKNGIFRFKRGASYSGRLAKTSRGKRKPKNKSSLRISSGKQPQILPKKNYHLPYHCHSSHEPAWNLL